MSEMVGLRCCGTARNKRQKLVFEIGLSRLHVWEHLKGTDS